MHHLQTDVEIWILPLSSDPKPNRAMEWLDKAEISRSMSFVHNEDRELYLQSHSWLRRILGELLCTPPEHVEFSTTPLGKPTVKNHCLRDPLWFSLSHTKQCIAIAASKTLDLGVDIEGIPIDVDLGDLAPMMLSQDEADEYITLHTENHSEHLMKVWTVKEAYLKAIGTGLTRDMTSLEVKLNMARKAIIRDNSATTKSHVFDAFWDTFYSEQSGNRFAFACAATSNISTVTINTIRAGVNLYNLAHLKNAVDTCTTHHLHEGEHA